MRRITWALPAGLLALLLALPGAGRAADEGPAGNWKIMVFQRGKMQLIGLLQLESSGGKWTAKSLDGGVKISDATVADGALRFTLGAGDVTFKFEGKVPKGDAKSITGNFSDARNAIPAELERTKLTKLDPFELEKEALAKATGFEVTAVAMGLLSDAQKNKAKPEEVKEWADKAYKAAEPYGARVQADIAFELAESLSDQDGYGDTAVVYARKAEENLGPKPKLSRTKRVLDVLAASLKKAGKAEDAKKVQERLDKLDTEIKPAAFAGRKAKSNRVVLVELFTGAQCPPCVAADKAFDALEKTYKPSEVVQLEYHLHNPGPDPLTCPPGEKRSAYYFGPMGAATPSILFNGAAGPSRGGDRYFAIEKYDEYVQAINPLLETPAKAVLKATATRKGDKIDISAEATDVADPADHMRLRLALVEEQIDFKGGNGIPAYRHVVRDLPGGTAGFPVTEKTAKQSATVDVGKLKKDLAKYLDEWEKENDKFPQKPPLIELKNLRVVAFLQNDKTREVIQAVQVDVKEEKEK